MPESHSPWLAIVNPQAGRSRGQSWPVVERALRDAGIQLDVEHTTAARDGEHIARRALQAGRQRLLVAGGDGSVHDVVNGILGAEPHDRAHTVFAVAPLGTGNDWARSLGMDLPPPALAATIAAGRTVAHDVGVIDFPEAVPPTRRWFINVAGAGYDAHVIGRLPPHVPSSLAYLRAALTGLISYRAPRFTIEVNGELIDRRLLLAFVAFAQACCNGMRVAPTARVDDGLLDLVTIDEVVLASALLKIAKLYRGTLLGDAVVRHVRSRQLRIDADPPADVEAEGQIVGRTPAVFSVLPGALDVVVPREAG